MTRIIVASINPIKINAVKHAFNAMMPGLEISIMGVEVPSNISAQPKTSKETEYGAVQRVENAKRAYPDADYWVGIEGGVEDNESQEMESFAWVVIESRDGTSGRGKTGTFVLPPKVVQLIREGMELGEADDIVFGQINSKQKMGAVGLLTGNVITRESYYAHAAILALIRFKNVNLFHEG